MRDHALDFQRRRRGGRASAEEESSIEKNNYWFGHHRHDFEESELALMTTSLGSALMTAYMFASSAYRRSPCDEP